MNKYLSPRAVNVLISLLALCLASQFCSFCSAAGETSTEESWEVVDDNMCGPYCLWWAARIYEKEASLKSIAELANTDPFRGTSVKDMLNAAESMGLKAELVEADLKGIVDDGRIAILLVKNNTHYVMFDGTKDGRVWIMDGRGRFSFNMGKLASLWDGLAIMIGENRGQEGRNFEVRLVRRILMAAGAALVIMGVILLLYQRRRRAKATKH